MNPNEQRLAIAMACGWIEIHEQWIDNIANAFSKELVGKHTNNQWTYCEIPDFCNSLDAMAQAEKVIEPCAWSSYTMELRRIIQRDCNKAECYVIGTERAQLIADFWFYHATAAHRAEAFLRTLGLWKESAPPAAES